MTGGVIYASDTGTRTIGPLFLWGLAAGSTCTKGASICTDIRPRAGGSPAGNVGGSDNL